MPQKRDEVVEQPDPRELHPDVKEEEEEDREEDHVDHVEAVHERAKRRKKSVHKR